MKTADLAFDDTPHGYTTHERESGECPGTWCCGCATSLEPQFRAQSIADLEELTARFSKATKPVLRAWITERGGFPAGGKESLVSHAVTIQMQRWWPTRTIHYGAVAC